MTHNDPQPEKVFLDESDMQTLAFLADRARDLAHHAHLAQLSVDAFIRLSAARLRLDPDKEYSVSPRGELVELRVQAPPGAGPHPATPQPLASGPLPPAPTGAQTLADAPLPRHEPANAGHHDRRDEPAARLPTPRTEATP